jgi:hypothetical protein
MLAVACSRTRHPGPLRTQNTIVARAAQHSAHCADRFALKALSLPPGSDCAGARRVRKRKAAQPPPNVRRAHDGARQAPHSTRTAQPLRPVCEHRAGRPACAKAQTARSECRKKRQLRDRASRLRPASGRSHTIVRGAVHAHRVPARAMAWTLRVLDPPPYLVLSSSPPGTTFNLNHFESLEQKTFPLFFGVVVEQAKFQVV